MGKAYLLGIPELDAQHEGIGDIVTPLLEAIERIDPEPRDIVAPHILDHDKHFAGFLGEHFGTTQS